MTKKESIEESAELMTPEVSSVKGALAGKRKTVASHHMRKRCLDGLAV